MKSLSSSLVCTVMTKTARATQFLNLITPNFKTVNNYKNRISFFLLKVRAKRAALLLTYTKTFVKIKRKSTEKFKLYI